MLGKVLSKLFLSSAGIKPGLAPLPFAQEESKLRLVCTNFNLKLKRAFSFRAFKNRFFSALVEFLKYYECWLVDWRTNFDPVYHRNGLGKNELNNRHFYIEHKSERG